MSSRKSRGCLGCGVRVLLILLLVLVLLFLWTWAVRSGLLVRLGLRKSAAQQVLGSTPNYPAMQALRAELAKADIAMEAVTLYVYPLKEQPGNALVIRLDTSKLTGLLGEDVANQAAPDLESLLTGKLAEQLEIEQIALDYRLPDGRPLIRATGSTDALRRLVTGELDQGEIRREFIWLIDPMVALQEGF